MIRKNISDKTLYDINESQSWYFQWNCVIVQSMLLVVFFKKKKKNYEAIYVVKLLI